MACTFSSHPVFSLDEARRFEEHLFGGDEPSEWAAMQRAGDAVGEAVMADFGEAGRWPNEARVLVLAGKGHNGGDALLAARTILGRCTGAKADVVLVFGERSLRPLVMRALRDLVHDAAGRVKITDLESCSSRQYDVMLDGVFGFQFRPPVAPPLATVFRRINGMDVRFRAAIDLPSGLGAPEALKADFTYATGSVKLPCVDDAFRSTAGRLRYLDLGFFGADVVADISTRVLTRELLAPLAALRPAVCDKRSYGHLFIVGGSRSYPGAVLMSALAAVHSGAGLVTAFVPESLAPAFAARLPEVIWVGWPEAPDGGLSLEGSYLFRERADRATALLVGPGISREPETLALVNDLVKTSRVPVVIDADALQKDIVRAGTAPRILTPHAGEFARIAGGAGLKDFAHATHSVTVLKSSLTRVTDGGDEYYSCHGGPVLARGGSGDVLCGLTAGLLAQEPESPLLAACRGVLWHGLAADDLAREQGAGAVATTQLVDHLASVLRRAGA